MIICGPIAFCANHQYQITSIFVVVSRNVDGWLLRLLALKGGHPSRVYRNVLCVELSSVMLLLCEQNNFSIVRRKCRQHFDTISVYRKTTTAVEIAIIRVRPFDTRTTQICLQSGS